MKVSIITVTYNSAATLADTLECIKKQTHPDIEHIIVDGGSKDNTLDIVKAFPHVARWISEPDKGTYDAMNKGLRMATGDLIGILNSDDYYAHDDVIARIVKQVENKKADSIYANLQYINQETDKVVRTWISGNYDRTRFYYGWMPPHPTFFVKKSIYEKFGLFDTNLWGAADYELMLRFLFKYKVSSCYLPEIIIKMRVGGQSNQSIYNRFRAHMEDRSAWERNGLKPRFYTLPLKPISKVKQFFIR